MVCVGGRTLRVFLLEIRYSMASSYSTCSLQSKLKSRCVGVCYSPSTEQVDARGWQALGYPGDWIARLCLKGKSRKTKTASAGAEWFLRCVSSSTRSARHTSFRFPQARGFNPSLVKYVDSWLALGRRIKGWDEEKY